MSVFVVTVDTTAQTGWGRYSREIVKALRNSDLEVVISDAAMLPKPLSARRNYFLAFWYAWKLRKYAKQCDVIHCFVEPYSHIAYWLSKFIGKKYVITVHGTYGVLPFHQTWWQRFFHKKSFMHASKIICVSTYTKEVLSTFGLINVQVINNGINFDEFYASPIPDFGERNNIVLSVGALKHRKGQHVSLEAFANIVGTIPNALYYLVGDQRDKAYVNHLKKLIAALGIEHSVKFLSSISDEALIELYRRAKVLVLTSLSSEKALEGFGLVYLEANACGTPVIGSFNSGAEDAIQAKKTGFLVPQNDAEILSTGMRRLLQDRDLWQYMSTEGLEWAKEHDWNKIIQEYIKIYKLV